MTLVMLAGILHEKELLCVSVAGCCNALDYTLDIVRISYAKRTRGSIKDALLFSHCSNQYGLIVLVSVSDCALYINGCVTLLLK